MISICEKKNLGFIFGGIQENETWRRSNFKLYQTYKYSDIVNFINNQRFKRAGYVVRLNEDHTTKRVFNVQPMGNEERTGRILDGLRALE
ncbi:uncharacterized protein TNCV_4237501 [Trichonephila clavipes]|nr:uncharacterized protein TNCV_4237501 [Trichonephila clavipes]